MVENHFKKLSFHLMPDHDPQTLIHRKVRPHPVEEDEDFVLDTQDGFEVYKKPE